MIYCKKEIIHLRSDLKVRILSSLLISPMRKGSTKGISDDGGRKGKGAVMMIFFHPLAILHVVLLSTCFVPFEPKILKKLSTS